MTRIQKLLDFFIPRICPSCKSQLDFTEEVICRKCLPRLKRVSEDIIFTEFQDKFKKDKIISDFTSLYYFEKDKEVHNIIHEFKYNGKFRIGLYLGALIACNLETRIRSWNIDYIFPVPLHHLRRSERGFNQSYYIAKGIKSELKIPIAANLLKRQRFTDSQTHLSIIERKENVKDAFLVKKNKIISGKNILLLDDVITTGATISECGKVLLKAGTAKIYAASVAIPH
jgi:ComF family protein